jgi:hypothetical protein
MGMPPPTLATVATRAEELRQAAAILREQPCAAAQNVAGVLERWLVDGGDLVKMLGLRPGRGRASETPQRAARMSRRDTEIRAAAAGLGSTVNEQAEILFAKLQARDDPQLLVLHELGVPTSKRQLVRVLRAPSRD